MPGRSNLLVFPKEEYSCRSELFGTIELFFLGIQTIDFSHPKLLMLNRTLFQSSKFDGWIHGNYIVKVTQ